MFDYGEHDTPEEILLEVVVRWGNIELITPVIEWVREDMVYDVAWSPIRPSLFTTVDGSGALELWDLTSSDPEIPVAWTRDSGALNKVCWETGPEGRRVVTGALDGRVQVWDLPRRAARHAGAEERDDCRRVVDGGARADAGHVLLQRGEGRPRQRVRGPARRAARHGRPRAHGVPGAGRHGHGARRLREVRAEPRHAPLAAGHERRAGQAGAPGGGLEARARHLPADVCGRADVSTAGAVVHGAVLAAGEEARGVATGWGRRRGRARPGVAPLDCGQGRRTYRFENMNQGSETGTRVPRLRSRLRQATCEAILAAAEEAIAERGLHAAGMAEIATRAGVSVGTLYNHFADKDAILAALVGERRRQMLARVDAALEACRGQPFRAQLGAYLEGALRALRRAPPLLPAPHGRGGGARGPGGQARRRARRRDPPPPREARQARRPRGRAPARGVGNLCARADRHAQERAPPRAAARRPRVRERARRALPRRRGAATMSARPPVNKWLVTVSIAFGTLMAAIDSSIVNVALPGDPRHGRRHHRGDHLGHPPRTSSPPCS